MSETDVGELFGVCLPYLVYPLPRVPSNGEEFDYGSSYKC
jgi:hypothetical protein